jgi:hypothetical protein
MLKTLLITTALTLPLALGNVAAAQAPAKKPNILVIMGDDIGWFNLGAYNGGAVA